MFMVRSCPRVRDSLEMNSMETSPAPPTFRMMDRKWVSVIPAMGARIRGGSTFSCANSGISTPFARPFAGRHQEPILKALAAVYNAAHAPQFPNPPAAEFRSV